MTAITSYPVHRDRNRNTRPVYHPLSRPRSRWKPTKPLPQTFTTSQDSDRGTRQVGRREQSPHSEPRPWVFTVYEWSDTQTVMSNTAPCAGTMQNRNMSPERSPIRWTIYGNSGYWKPKAPPGITTTKVKCRVCHHAGRRGCSSKRRNRYKHPPESQFTVTKQGETLTRCDFRQTEFGLWYEPVFEVQAKENAAYEPTALEDIVLPDGTVKYKAGELVQTATTEMQPDGGICPV